MELLYVWIEKYRNIEQEGFNFSPRWRFDYNSETGFLNIEDRREQVIDNFFGERISNVTAIVGANGSGKTTLITFLVNLINGKDENGVCIFLSEGELIVGTFFGGENRKFDFDKKYHKKINKVNWHVDLRKRIRKIRGAYISHFFNGRSEIHSSPKYIFDLSTNYLLAKKQQNKPNPSISASNEFRILEIKKQARFVAAFNFSEKNIQFQLPNFLLFNSNGEYESRRLIELLERNNALKEDTLTKIGKIDAYITTNDFIGEITNSLCFYSLIERFRFTKGAPFYILLDDFIENIERQREFVDFQFSQDSPLEVKQIPDFVKFISNNFTFNDNRQEYLLPLQTLKKFFDYCMGIGWAENCFYFEWRFGEEQQYGSLSSGEEHLINIFSRIHAQNFTTNSGSPLIIFLDEAELGLHPEWQRKFIDTLAKLLPEMLPDKSKIQIILSTHSPFILSDLPKENVIFLSKDEQGKCKVHDGLKDKKQSFGANIHTLLSDGFFMDSLIGEFAKDKIDKVIKFLNNEPTGLIEEDVQKIINMIGEPILQRELQRRLKLRDVDALKIEVANLQARITELENQDQ